MTASARDQSLRIEDRDARRAARTVFDAPIVLEAGAGTGKTTALVARVVAWLVDAGFERALERLGTDAPIERAALDALDGLLAITFTEAAAADMDAKIRTALALVESGRVPIGMESHAFRVQSEDLRMRARALRRALERPIAQTIHAFCQRILARHPLEAGLHPQFTVDADGRAVAEVARQCVAEDLARRLAKEPDPDWIVLAARNIGPLAVEEALTRLAIGGHRAAELADESFTRETIVRIDAELWSAARAFLDACSAHLAAARKGTPNCGTLLDALQALVNDATKTATDISTLDARARRLRTHVGAGVFEKLEPWAAGDFGKRICDAIGEGTATLQLHSRILSPLLHAYARLDPELESAARRILERTLAATRTRLVARGVETFGDLLRDARDLLARDTDVRNALSAGFTQILVDEFQDTDPVQCDLVRFLALDPDSARRPGLLLVGDPKQSIYGFRNADLRAYEAFVDDVLKQRGAKHRLSLNFRSGQKILDFVESALQDVMVAEPGLQPGFQPLIAARGASSASLEFWNPREYESEDAQKKTSSAAATRIEARFLASELLASRARGVEWREMAVLLRSMTSIDVLLDALRTAGVPFDVAGDKSYYQRREVLDASAMLTCIVDPGDHLALLAFLRAPFVGLPDALLIPLWLGDFPALAGRLDATRPESLSRVRACVRTALERMPRQIPGLPRIAGFEASLDHALEALSALRASFARDSADVFLEHMRLLCLDEATAGARFQGAYRVANLERFFTDVAHELEASGGDTFALLRFLRTAIASAPETAEAKPRDAAASAVQIMTIHKSKGLDFREVFLLGLGKKRSRGRSSGPRTKIQGDAHVLFGAPNPEWFAVEALEERRELAEEVRVIYVALTRAKDRLVLSGDLALKQPSLLAHLEDAIHADARPYFDAWTASAARDVTLGDVVYRVADRIPEPAREKTAKLALDAWTAAAERDSRTLLAARAAAQRRSNVPSATAMSRIVEPIEGWAARSTAASVAPPSIAALAGTAIHGALEALDVRGDQRAGALRVRSRLSEFVSNEPQASSLRHAATIEAERLFDAFVSGPIFAHWERIASHVVARELPVLARHESATGLWIPAAGAIDLVYRDEQSGELVVVDYKTDSVADEAALRARVLHHRPQIDAYRHALQAALALPKSPRAELWFLSSGRIEHVA